MNPARILQIAGLAVGVFALVLQFVLTIPASLEAGRSLIGSILFYFSFFTILTNILVVSVHGSMLAGRPAFFRKPSVRAGVAVAIAVVGIIYFTMLRNVQQLSGLHELCTVLLHYIAPPVYVLWWLLAGRDGSTKWSDVLLWLIYPLAYLAYTMARAPIVGEVPYPFLDFTAHGARPVVVSALTIAALFIVLGLIAVFVDRTLGRSRTPGIQSNP